MFRPSGVVAQEHDVEPELARTAAAPRVVVAPLAVSIASLKRPSRSGSGRASRACAMYASTTSACSTGMSAEPPTCQLRVGDDRLDVALERLGELLAAAGEHLDAVVLERIVRGGDHETGVEAHRPRDVGDRRRRHDAGAREQRALGAHAARELALDPFARLARVAADDELERPLRERPHRRRAHRAHERRAEPRDRLGSSGYSPAFPRTPSVPNSRI